MGLIPKWVGEFPRSLIESFKESFQKSWPEFKEEVSRGTKVIVAAVTTGTKTVGEGIGHVFKGVLTGFTPTLILIAIILVLALIFYKKIIK